MAGEPTSGLVRLPAAQLRRWAAGSLRACGVPRPDAALVAGSLVQTSLWGIDSHGIALLPHYLRRIRAGSIAAKPVLRFVATGPSTGTLHGGHGLGLVVCHRAMAAAIALARRAGWGSWAVGIRRTAGRWASMVGRR
jgi:ureidoglycolate dehydrogenase (NAD+)